MLKTSDFFAVVFSQTWYYGDLDLRSTMDKQVQRLIEKIRSLERENSQLKQSQVEINVAKELYLKIFQNFPALIWRARTDKVCDYFNSTWLKFTGKTLEQEMNNGWADGVHPDDYDNCLGNYFKSFDKRESFVMDYRLKHNSGQYRWIRDIGQPYFDLDGVFLGYIGSCYDITESRNNEKRLEELSVTDPLTKVFNRLKIESVLRDEIQKNARFNNPLSLILMDIDNFKSVNDNYGHVVGDLVLTHMCELLRSNIRAIDVLGRWGAGAEKSLL